MHSQADHLTAVDSSVGRAAHTLFLRFGHVAVRYTTSDGAQRVMNILGGVEGADLVNFVRGRAGEESRRRRGRDADIPRSEHPARISTPSS